MERINDTGLRITRILSAPPERVWQAWTEPDRVAEWWGPFGFRNDIHRMDLTPGGEWRLTMYGPDGKSYPNRSEFVEIVPGEKIVFRHFNPDYLAQVVFEPVSETGTRLEWTVHFKSAELFNTVVRVFKADEGLKQNIEKLEKYLADHENR